MKRILHITLLLSGALYAAEPAKNTTSTVVTHPTSGSLQKLVKEEDAIKHHAPTLAPTPASNNQDAKIAQLEKQVAELNAQLHPTKAQQEAKQKEEQAKWKAQWDAQVAKWQAEEKQREQAAINKFEEDEKKGTLSTFEKQQQALAMQANADVKDNATMIDDMSVYFNKVTLTHFKDKLLNLWSAYLKTHPEIDKSVDLFKAQFKVIAGKMKESFKQIGNVLGMEKLFLQEQFMKNWSALIPAVEKLATTIVTTPHDDLKKPEVKAQLKEAVQKLHETTTAVVKHLEKDHATTAAAPKIPTSAPAPIVPPAIKMTPPAIEPAPSIAKSIESRNNAIPKPVTTVAKTVKK